MKKEYRKRRYRSIIAVLGDLLFILIKIPQLVRNRFARWVSPEFQERLMITVTAVNGCRYCSYYHARSALRLGFAPEEVNNLLAGEIHDPDPDELPALLYAQHWAESDARPEAELREQLYTHYPPQRAAMMETILRMIRFGNLSGNSWDYFLFCISGGRWGQ